MTWQRLEGSSVGSDLDEGLAARIADPLWMIARQWQVGELTGEDASSPILVKAVVETGEITDYRIGKLGPVARQDLKTPLETEVEAESVVQGPASKRVSAEAGLHFLRLLDDGLRAPFRKAYAFVAGSGNGLDPRGRNWLRMMERRALDGASLYAALSVRGADAAALPHGPKVAGAAQQTRVRKAAAQWLLWYESRFREPRRREPDSIESAAWSSERMEYGLEVCGHSDQGDVFLAADEYPGGHLDWYHFDTRSKRSFEPSSGELQRHRRTLLPTTLRYAGMPASRWWEFEDGDVYFGSIEAGPEDIARVIVASYATVYGDDWFLVPFDLPLGSVSRVTSLRIVDDFGREHPVRSLAQNDGPNRVWRFFELSGDTSVADGHAPILYLPSVLAGAHNGRPLEEVDFIRDEAANMAWAVERTIESEAGRRVDRRARWLRRRRAEPVAEYGGNEDAWRYSLATDVPEHWIPLLPVQVRGSHDMVLQRARMPQRASAAGEVSTAGARGDILRPSKPLFIREEEVPRGGVRVVRHFQYARGADGRAHLWVGRLKRPGRGEQKSRLRYDDVDTKHRGERR